MTQLSSAILALQTDSVFAREYAKGCHKSTYWDHSYEDMMNLIARLPEVRESLRRARERREPRRQRTRAAAPPRQVCAIIYRCTYFDGKVPSYDPTTDYSGNFCQMLGYNDPAFHEMMRLYICIHSDHEGGNASAVCPARSEPGPAAPQPC